MKPFFFARDSFWNTPIPADAVVAARSDAWIAMLAGEPEPNFWLNIDRYTIPVYEVDDRTPRRDVGLYHHPMHEFRISGHHPDFIKPVPIPDRSIQDPGNDRHIAFVDFGRRTAWDMFYAIKTDDGEWTSLSGVSYSIDGSGVFDPASCPVKPGESIHRYGLCRAAGTPLLAGLVMREEVASGEINHKIAFASACNAYQEYQFPAVWTDGFTDNGLPEGCLVRLDPSLDVESLGLSAGGTIIARALQRYGAVNVDVAGGTVLYCEGRYGQALAWEGLLEPSDLRTLDIRRFQVIETGPIFEGGRHYSETDRHTLHDRLWGKLLQY